MYKNIVCFLLFVGSCEKLTQYRFLTKIGRDPFVCFSFSRNSNMLPISHLKLYNNFKPLNKLAQGSICQLNSVKLL